MGRYESFVCLIVARCYATAVRRWKRANEPAAPCSHPSSSASSIMTSKKIKSLPSVVRCTFSVCPVALASGSPPGDWLPPITRYNRFQKARHMRSICQADTPIFSCLPNPEIPPPPPYHKIRNMGHSGTRALRLACPHVLP